MEASAISNSETPKRKKGGRTKEALDARASDCEEWAKLMPVFFDTSKEPGANADGGMEVDGEDTLEKLARHGIVDQKPFYTNTTLYSLLRLLQVRRERYLVFTAINLVLILPAPLLSSDLL